MKKLNEKVAKLEKKYNDLKDEINVIKANGSLSTLYNLRNEFDETFDRFFDNEDLRKKYEDWDYEEDCIMFEKSGVELLEEFDKEDLEEYIKFYEGYIQELESELEEMKEQE